MNRILATSLFLFLAFSSVAHAEESGTPQAAPAPAAKEEAPKPIGLAIGLELSSIYNFRGVNSFGGGNQAKQNPMIAPSLTWSIFDTGLSLGWWSAYQAWGSNRKAMVDAALGHEQDIVLGYSHGFLDDTLTLSAGFAAYLYPFASKRDIANGGAGTTCPTYLEPSVGLAYAGPVDVGLGLSYFAGVQEAIKDYRYLYINPRIGKTFAVTKALGMGLTLSYGYKLFNDRDKMKDNVHDIRFDYELPIAVTDAFSVTPNIHTAWTNYAGKTSGDEYMVYGGLRLGYEF